MFNSTCYFPLRWNLISFGNISKSWLGIWSINLVLISLLYINYTYISGFPDGSAGKEFACKAGDLGLIPWLGRSSGEGKGYPPVFWPGEFYGLCSPRGHKELDMTERLSFHFSQIQRSYSWMRPVSQRVSSLSSWPQGLISSNNGERNSLSAVSFHWRPW